MQNYEWLTFLLVDNICRQKLLNIVDVQLSNSSAVSGCWESIFGPNIVKVEIYVVFHRCGSAMASGILFP
jgi:hypothetical protein